MSYIYDKEWELITCTMLENSIEHGVRGIVPMKRIEEMEKDFLEDEREARMTGKPVHLAGTIFKEFRDRIFGDVPWCHVFSHEDMFPEAKDHWRGWTNYCAIDTHPVKPYEVTLIKIDPDGRALVYGEYQNDGGVDDCVDLIKSMYTEWGGKPFRFLIEPQAQQQDAGTHKTLKEQFISKGIYCMSWAKHDSPRISKIHDWFVYNEDLGSPKLMVSSRCPRLIWGFKHWCYNEKTGKPDTINDDLIDCVGGTLCDKPKFRGTFNPSYETHYEKQGYFY